MNIFSARLISVRHALGRLPFRASRLDTFNYQRVFYSSSDIGGTLLKGENKYGDEVLVSGDVSNIPSVVETLPDLVSEASFQSMGLGGFTPVGLLQEALEFLHVSVDLPWWGAIAVGTTVIRVCLMPLAVNNRKEMTKMMTNTYEVARLMSEAEKARKEQNIVRFMKIYHQHQALMNNMKFSKIIVPPLIQGSIFLTMLLAMRGIAAAPIESLTTGGIAWFTDLSLPDPFGILPLFTASSIFAVLLIGRDNNVPLPKTVLGIFYVMSPIVFVALYKYQASITFYFFVNSALTVLQTAVLNQPAVKSFFGINFPPRDHQKAAAEDFIKIQRTFSELFEREVLQDMIRKRRTQGKESKEKEEGDEKDQLFEEKHKKKDP